MPSKATLSGNNTLDILTELPFSFKTSATRPCHAFQKGLRVHYSSRTYYRNWRCSTSKVRTSTPHPIHYSECVHNQLQEMAQEGIVRRSNSPWCAPAGYVPKSNGEIWICVNFVQLNKVTKKDAYPVPRAEGPQQRLANK